MIPYAEPVYFGNEERYVADAVHSKWISGGEYVEKFEEALTNHLGQPTITTSNGTTALELAYLSIMSHGWRDRYNVIVPAFGFMAAANVAKNLGLEVRFADVLSDTWDINPWSVRSLIDENTLAVVVIHNYGNPCNMEYLRGFLDDTNVFLIEDCAEAIFSKYKDHEVSTIGDIGTFSFHATKTITTGEGGALTTNNAKVLENAKLIKNHGMAQRGTYLHTDFGMNFRMSNIHAAMGLAQMEKKEEIRTKKRAIDSIYWQLLRNVEGITLQKFTKDSDPCPWATAIKVGESFPYRDDIIPLMKKAGIEIRPGFLSPTFLPIYKRYTTPVADELSQTILSLPCSMSLDEEKIKYVCDTLLSFRKDTE